MEKIFDAYHFFAIENETSLDEVDRLAGTYIQRVVKILENGVIKRKANRY